jgi:hypothetical protein
MFWNLFLAHLLGDYPLQPMWLVRSKSQIWGLALHGSIHLLTLLLLVGSFRSLIWPQILALAVFHFFVDVVKYRTTEGRPEWTVSSYFIDQAVHITSIIVVSAWINSIVPEAGAAFNTAIYHRHARLVCYREDHQPQGIRVQRRSSNHSLAAHDLAGYFSDRPSSGGGVRNWYRCCASAPLYQGHSMATRSDH